jgi:hypothetical protein
MMPHRVIIPERPRSVLYHVPGCGNIDESKAAELDRADAEALGFRAHGCVRREADRPDDDGHGREVPA